METTKTTNRANVLNGLDSARLKHCADLGRAFQSLGATLYLVGGAVRDLLLGRTEADLDFTTSAAPELIRKAARRSAKAVFDKSPAKGFGTQGVVFNDGIEADITPYRSAWGDAAADVSAVTLEEDLSSRDFTINAMAISVTPDTFGQMTDNFSGANDLTARILKTPAAPADTLRDDPLRAMRAMRFARQFELEPVPALETAIRAMTADPAKPFDAVAMERVREELFKALTFSRPSISIRRMADWGLLGAYLPEVDALRELVPEPGRSHKDVFEHTLRIADGVAESLPGNSLAVFAAMLHDIGKPSTRIEVDGGYAFTDHEKVGADMADAACARLRMSNDDGSYVRALVRKHARLAAYTGEWTDGAVRRALNELGPLYQDILALSSADITGSDPELLAQKKARLEHFLERVDRLDREAVFRPRPPIDGHEIMSIMGKDAGARGGGREVGLATEYLKRLLIDGALAPDDAETARRLVRERAWENPDIVNE